MKSKFGYMSEEQFRKKLEKIREKNLSAERKRILRESKQYGFKLPSTSKLVLWLVLFYCVQLTFFIERRIELSNDSYALVSLIGVLTTLISVVLGYYKKSSVENTEGGIVFESAMRENENEPCG